MNEIRTELKRIGDLLEKIAPAHSDMTRVRPGLHNQPSWPAEPDEDFMRGFWNADRELMRQRGGAWF